MQASVRTMSEAMHTVHVWDGYEVVFDYRHRTVFATLIGKKTGREDVHGPDTCFAHRESRQVVIVFFLYSLINDCM